jgi:uncharacterized membrane protein
MVPVPIPEKPTFSARLTPHRSLSRWGFLVVMIAFGLASFVTGLVFTLMGAWPVAGFLGLDVALVYLAFKMNTRDARAAELVEVDRTEVRLVRIDSAGRSDVERFNRSWVRVELDETSDGRNHLRLVSRDRRLTFGRFLTNEERVDLKAALETALRAARPLAR